MNYTMTEEVLKKTKQCPNGFACLHTGKGKCEVYNVDGEDILYISYNNICRCPYRLSFGERQLCGCPTHYALHKKEQKMNACCCCK